MFSLMAFAVQWSAFSQVFNQGNFLIGSNVGFSTADSKVTSGGQSNEGLSSNQINIAPSIGYFLLNNFALGVGADFTLHSITEPNGDKTDDSDLLFGPFARLYFPASESVAFFAVANVGFGNSADNQTVSGVQQSIETNIIALGAGPGLTVYTRGGFGIEAILKYNYAKSKFDTEIAGVKTSNTTRTNQFAISLGLQYYFGGFRGMN
ncbi:MAG: outer membrane beta-barrel protein [Saprospiraceae bacterium]|nr:outer membrane beta-barrel protein [Saprospiraceae bacterium]